MNTVTVGRILWFIIGLLEGWFFVGLFVISGFSVNPGLFLVVVLLIYLFLVVIHQADNIFEIIGVVVGGLIATTAQLSPTGLEGATAMGFAIVLIGLIIVRFVRQQAAQ